MSTVQQSNGVLYTALELSNKTWKLGFSNGPRHDRQGLEDDQGPGGGHPRSGGQTAMIPVPPRFSPGVSFRPPVRHGPARPTTRKPRGPRPTTCTQVTLR